MSGVISPTNLSLYSSASAAGVSPAVTHRTTPRTRWNPPFLSMEDDFNMMSHTLSSTNPEATPVILMEDCKYKPKPDSNSNVSEKYL